MLELFQVCIVFLVVASTSPLRDVSIFDLSELDTWCHSQHSKTFYKSRNLLASHQYDRLFGKQVQNPPGKKRSLKVKGNHSLKILFRMNHRLGHEYLTLPALFEQKFTKVFPEQMDCNLQFYRVISQSLTICRLKYVRTLLSSIWLIMISLGHHREETVMNNFVRQLLNIRKPNSIHPMFTIFHTATLHAYILSLVHFP